MTGIDAVSPTVFHVATPTGRGAIATIIVQGQGAMSCVNNLFQPCSGQPLGPQQFGRIIYGHWIVNGQTGEDLVVCPRDNQWIEIHCHGGETACDLISETLRQSGAVNVDGKELTVRVSGNGYLADLNRAISTAPTVRTARVLLAQPGLHRLFWQRLLETIESQDYSAATGLIERFLAHERFGRHLVEPWSVVFCGAPNVGKSSLINALLGFQRSIVHPIAGTTRDTVNALTALDGWPVNLFDTAGIRDTTDAIEQLGIEAAKQTIQASDLVILVLDSSAFTPDDLNIPGKRARPDLLIANKTDLAQLDEPTVDLHVSAKTGLGIESLIERVSQMLVPVVPDLTEPIPVAENQILLLDEILESVQQQDWQQARENIAHASISLP